jgi:flagellar secretion chaperone FliS
MTLAIQTHTSATNSTAAAHNDAPAVDPHGFTRLLMMHAQKRIVAARKWSKEGDPVAVALLIESAVRVLGALRSGLDLQNGGDIAANVDDLYDYMCRRLNTADPTNGLATLHEVSHLLDALRSAWAFMPAEVRAASRN